MAISKSRANRTATTCWAKASSRWPASPTVGPCFCAIRPRRNATTAAPSRSSSASKPCGDNYRTKNYQKNQTNPFPGPNPNKIQPLAPPPKRTRLLPKRRPNRGSQRTRGSPGLAMRKVRLVDARSRAPSILRHLRATGPPANSPLRNRTAAPGLPHGAHASRGSRAAPSKRRKA